MLAITNSFAENCAYLYYPMAFQIVTFRNAANNYTAAVVIKNVQYLFADGLRVDSAVSNLYDASQAKVGTKLEKATESDDNATEGYDNATLCNLEK